jgi:undecaprenyl-diphosphatase
METFNQHLFLLMNAPANASLLVIALARYIAEILIWLVPITLVVGWFKGGEANRRALLVAALSGAAGLLLAQLLGWLWPHARPFAMGLGTNHLAHGVDSSFPSDHLTLIWSVAFSLLTHPRLRLIGVALAMLGLPVAWARIYLGVHFPLDMVGAALVAILSAGLCFEGQRWLVPPVYAISMRIHRALFSRCIQKGWTNE